MKIMGLTDTAYFLSWITHYLMVFTVIATINTIQLKYTAFQYSNVFLVFAWLMLYYIVNMAKAMFISSLFTEAKYGVTVAIVLYFVEDIIIANFTTNSA